MLNFLNGFCMIFVALNGALFYLMVLFVNNQFQITRFLHEKYRHQNFWCCYVMVSEVYNILDSKVEKCSLVFYNIKVFFF